MTVTTFGGHAMAARQKMRPDGGGRPDLAGELRALRRRSRLTLAALAERTCYSKSSWERYLNGKALPPVSALKAFAETVGVSPARLLVLRSLTEEGDATPDGEQDPAEAVEPVPEPETVPAEPSADGETPAAGSRSLVRREPDVPEQVKPTFLATVRSAADPERGDRRRRTVPAVFLALGLVIGVAAGLGLAQLFRSGPTGAQHAATADAEKAAGPAVAGCVGVECKGKDPERFDCHQKAWTAAARRVDGVYVQLRYSPTCQAAWGRIVLAEVGDVAVVKGAEGHTARRAVTYGHDVYTSMVDAPYPAAAHACAELGGGERVCTDPGAASPVPATTPQGAAPGS